MIATPDCAFMTIVEEQSANRQRGQALDVMSNWLSGGLEFDAVIANNDEMALGAIQATHAAGTPMSEKVIAGIDATRDGPAAMKAWDLDVTVFQDAKGQGRGAIDAGAQDFPRREGGPEGLYSLPARHAREHGRFRGDELRPA